MTSVPSFVTKSPRLLEPTSPDQIDTLYIESEFQTELQLDVFKEVASDYVVNLIKSSPDKSYELDPMPTKMFRENVEVERHH